MKKIHELTVERSELIAKMEEITKNENLSEELRSEWTQYDDKIKVIDNEIALLERQENLNKNNFKPMENTLENVQPLEVRFRDWLKDAVEKGTQSSFRVEPMLSTSNTDILNKTVANSVDILTSPAEAWLRSIGVTFYTGLNGQLVIPRMEQETASFFSEATCGGDASMNFSDLVLAPRRITNSQSVTREFLAQTNPAIYASILQNLYNGIYNAVTNDVFDTLETDSATQITTTGTTATYQDILNLEASLGCFTIGGMSYVTTPAGKAFFKGLDVGSDGIKYAWNDNEMNGYPAYGVCSANANKVYFGDWSRQVVAQWGGLEIIVNPYTYAKCGKIELTVLGLFDTGTMNPAAFAILDASLA